MVDVLGHLAMGLLAALPVWAVWKPRPALAFLGFVLLMAMVPDIDLYLPWVAHHGPTHTLLFTGVVAVAGAGVAVFAAPTVLHRWSPWPESVSAASARLFSFAAAGLFLVCPLHVFSDVLATATWRLVGKPV
jgi:inner membrane protein